MSTPIAVGQARVALAGTHALGAYRLSPYVDQLLRIDGVLTVEQKSPSAIW
jgi:hypothetical protein